MRFLIAIFFVAALALICGCSGTNLQTIECDVGINCTPTPSIPGTVPTP
jgi:hypothetical protein